MVLLLSRADFQRCLNMTEAIEAMRTAFSALNAGQARAQQSMAVDLSEQSIALLMPSLLQTMKRLAFGLKVVTVMPPLPPSPPWSEKPPQFSGDSTASYRWRGKHIAVL
jgi:ornithine cyclodeaminase/alanine dehydrogenase-like protein (mu-crystallin family)